MAAPAGYFGPSEWGTEGPWYWIGNTRGDNERERVGEGAVVLNGRRYLRIGPRDVTPYLPFAGAGDIIDSQQWGRLLSVDAADRFHASSENGFWNGPGPVLLAAAALGAFMAPAVAGAGAVEGGASAGAVEVGSLGGEIVSPWSGAGSLGGELAAGASGGSAAAPAGGFSLSGAASSLASVARSLFSGGASPAPSLSVQGFPDPALNSPLSGLGWLVLALGAWLIVR
jgi:hypothetical protein